MLGYTIDPVANISIHDIVFKWFDHVLKDSAMPSIISNRVNYEIMGANEWRHVSSLNEMSNDTLTFYLSAIQIGDKYKLLVSKPLTKAYIDQQIDFKDTFTTTARGGEIDAFPVLPGSRSLRANA